MVLIWVTDVVTMCADRKVKASLIQGGELSSSCEMLPFILSPPPLCEGAIKQFLWAINPFMGLATQKE